MLDILIVTLYYYPRYGGAALRFKNYYPFFLKHNFECSFFAPILSKQNQKFNFPEDIIVSGDSKEKDSGIEVSKIPKVTHVPVPPHRTGWIRNGLFYRALFKYCKQEPLSLPDVIFMMSHPSWFAHPWVWGIQKLGIPLVFIHTLRGDLSKNLVRRALQKYKLSFELNVIDWIVTSSQINKESLSKDYGIQKPIEIISNGVNLERFIPCSTLFEKEKIRLKLGLSKDDQVILFIGAFNERKGADLMIDVWKIISRKYPRAHLLMVGRNNTTLFKKTQNMLKDSVEWHRLHLIGVVNNIEFYFQAADVFVFPSRREGFGNVVLEAMACGIPCVLTPFVGISDELGVSDKHFLLSGFSPKSISQQIMRLFENKDLRQNLTESGLAWVHKQHSVEKTITQYIKFVEKVILKKKYG